MEKAARRMTESFGWPQRAKRAQRKRIVNRKIVGIKSWI